MIGQLMKGKLAILLFGLMQITLWCASATHGAESKGFEKWLEDFRNQAVRQGISKATIETTLSKAKYLPEVMERYRNQPEFKLSLDEYLSRVVPERRVQLGRKKLGTHRTMLDEVYRRIPVEPQFIVALWGIESDFGQIAGTFPVIDALATLAYASSRVEFYQKELFHALRILDKGHVPPDRMKGSWAGAMGQVQFMPSSFQALAADYDGDGKVDIWDNLGDALFSAANYLSRSGWNTGQGWGVEVKVPKEFNPPPIGSKKPMTEWKAAGLREAGGSELPETPDLTASLIEPDRKSHRTFLVYPNYHVILKWNRSDFFALAVGTLADQINMGQGSTTQNGTEYRSQESGDGKQDTEHTRQNTEVRSQEPGNSNNE
jgi:membrane-bound lytic murein transglycosylase B